MVESAEASAPGKVILSGEHSVVHGYPAIAASIGIRARVEVEMMDIPGVIVESSGNIPQYHYTMDMLRAIKEGREYSALDSIASIVQSVKDKLIGEDSLGLRIHIDSEIPMSAGLGSSASVCVATTAAINKMFGLGLDKNEISEFAFIGEKIIHGKPSGIDNVASTFGGLVKFQKGQFEFHDLNEELPLVIANTRVERSTKKLVSAVSDRLERHRSLLSTVFDAMGRCSVKMLDSLKSGDITGVGELMDINHGLLESIGVGHPLLSTYVWEAKRAGALGAKLTGAGGGGCMIALAEDKGSAEEIARRLRDLDAQVVNTTLSPIGVS